MNRLVFHNPPSAKAAPTVTEEDALKERFDDYRGDESKLRCSRLLSLALPENQEQLIGALQGHAEAGHSVSIAGARTGLVGGCVAEGSGHLIALDRLKGIERMGTDSDGVPLVRVSSGTALAELYAWVEEHEPQWFYPVDPTEATASVGGTVATNASGPRSLYYGSTRDWVRGLGLVLVDGTVCNLNRGDAQVTNGDLVIEGRAGVQTLQVDAIPKPATKHSLGYSWFDGMDAVDLFVGSEGTLAVVSHVVLALAPIPAARFHFLQFFEDRQTAFDFVEYLRDSGRFSPLAIEWMDGRSLRLVAQSSVAVDLPYSRMVNERTAAAVYSELLLGEADEGEATLESLIDFLTECGVDAECSGGGALEQDLRQIKAFRHAVPEQVNLRVAQRQTLDAGVRKLSTDLAVPNQELRAFYARIEEELVRQGVDFVIFGHIGNSHLHVNLLPRGEGELHRIEELYREFARDAVARGGSVAAEHGIGRLKRSFLEIQYGPPHLESMRQIKSCFDPEWRLSPGVLVLPRG